MMIQADFRNRHSNIFTEIGAACLTVYIHWSYLRFVSNKFLLVVIFALAMFNFLIRKDCAVRWKVFQTAFLGLIMYCCIGTSYSPNALGGVRFLLQLVLAFCTCLILADDVDFLSTLFRWICISGVISVGAVILQILFPVQMLAICARVVKPSGYAMTAELYSFGYYSGLSGFNCIAGFHAASMMGMFFIKGLRTKAVGKRFLAYAIAAVSLFALVATQKRGVLLAALIATIVVLLYYFIAQRSLKKVVQLIFVLALIAAILFGILQNTEIGQKMLSRFENTEDISSGRFDNYQYIFENIGERICFGYGTGAMNVGLGNDAHNIYLQILYDHGAVGLGVYLLFFALPLCQCLGKIKRGNFSEFALTSLFLQVLFLCYGFTGNPLYDFCLFMLYLMAILIQDIPSERG